MEVPVVEESEPGKVIHNVIARNQQDERGKLGKLERMAHRQVWGGRGMYPRMERARAKHDALE
jgi:hypothetical protein